MSLSHLVSTILSGDTDGSIVYLNGLAVVGIELPDTFTGTGLSFLASTDEVNFRPVCNVDGSTYEVTVAQDTFCIIPPGDLVGTGALMIVSNASEAADREVVIVARPA